MNEGNLLVKITGMYENESAAGNKYFVGYAGMVKFVLLRNRDAGEGQPGWNLCVAQRPERGNDNRPAVAHHRSERSPKRAKKPDRPRVDPELDDAVPEMLA